MNTMWPLLLHHFDVYSICHDVEVEIPGFLLTILLYVQLLFPVNFVVLTIVFTRIHLLINNPLGRQNNNNNDYTSECVFTMI